MTALRATRVFTDARLYATIPLWTAGTLSIGGCVIGGAESRIEPSGSAWQHDAIGDRWLSVHSTHALLLGRGYRLFVDAETSGEYGPGAGGGPAPGVGIECR